MSLTNRQFAEQILDEAIKGLFQKQGTPRVSVDGRIRIRCRGCGEMSIAIFRYFPDDIHLAKSYRARELSAFFAKHVDCVELAEFFGAGIMPFEFVAD